MSKDASNAKIVNFLCHVPHNLLLDDPAGMIARELW
jgi:hypothetical protein